MNNKTRHLKTAFMLLLLVSLSACATTSADESSSLRDAFAEAATGDHRSAANQARNAYRHPAETLDFFGIERGMTVVEISPGGLWYTEVLAPALRDNGQFIVAGYDAAVPDQPQYRYRQQTAMEQRFKDEADIFGKVGIVKFSPPQTIELGEPGSVDVVVTFRNSHGWIRDGLAETIYQSFYDVLKPGGVLGVVQHRAAAGSNAEETARNGYVPEAAVVALASKAGFVLEESAEINANPKDTRDHPEGVWTLPPSLQLGDTDKEKYMAIGESDRMTLRFRKPQ